MTNKQIALLAASMTKIYAGLKRQYEPSADKVLEDAKKYLDFLNERFN